VPDGAGRAPTENVDISVTHWAGQYVPQAAWPAVCGPDGHTDPQVVNAEGKDCNEFHGDYTGLAVGADGAVNVVWNLAQPVRDLASDRCLHRPAA